MIICFTGIDGSGKTEQARRLVERLRAAGHPARYVWTGGRAYLTRPLIWAAKRLLRAPRRHAGADEPTSQAATRASYDAYLGATRTLFRRRWARALWRQVSLVEHAAEILANVLPPLTRGEIVVCDRYIYDSLIGIAVLAGTTPDELPAALRLPFYLRLPQPELWLLLDLPAQVAFERRTDVIDVAFLERRAPLYRAAGAALGAQRIDATAAREQIAAEVWRIVEPQLAGRRAAGSGPMTKETL